MNNLVLIKKETIIKRKSITHDGDDGEYLSQFNYFSMINHLYKLMKINGQF